MNLGTRFILACLGLMAAGVALYLAPFGAATTIDSLHYVFAAKAFANGLGIVQPNLGLEGPDMIPMTTWGPAYPVLLSLVLGVGLAGPLAAKLLNVLLLPALVMLFAATLKRHVGWGFAIPATVVLMLHPTILLIFSYTWSEPLFLVLEVAAFFFLQRHANSGQGERKWLLLGAACLALACYVRYIGVLFPLAAGACLLLARRPWRDRFSDLLFLGGATALMVLPMMLRNWLASGHFSGAERGIPPFRLGEDVMHMLNLLRIMLFGEMAWVAIAVSGLILAGTLLARPRVEPQTRDALLWAAAYLVGLLIIRTRQVVDLDFRMLSLVSPFLILAIASVAASLYAALENAGRRRLAGTGLAVWAVACAMGGALFMQAGNANWRQHGTPRFAAEPGVEYNNFTANPAYQPMAALHRALAGNAENAVVFYDFRPILHHHITGSRARALPGVLDKETVIQMNRLGQQGGYVLATTGPGMAALQAAYGTSLAPLPIAPEAAQMGVVAVKLPLPVPAP